MHSNAQTFLPSLQVLDIFQRTQAAFPEAEVMASTLDSFTLALQAALPRLQLPVVTEEIGDTWAYGIGSDADKVAEYRALLRMRTATAWKVQEAAYRNFSRLLLKVRPVSCYSKTCVGKSPWP